MEHIPLVKEVELCDILTKVHGLNEAEAIDIIRDLDDIHPNIHRVRLAGNEEAYFIAPVVSITALYRKIIKDKYTWYSTDPKTVLRYVSDYVQNLGRRSEFIEQIVIRSLKELEKTRHLRDKLYIYIYFNDVLLSQLTSDGETSQESFNEMLRDVLNLYASKPGHNIVIVIPKIKKQVLDGISRYLAIDEATEYIINRYIAALERGVVTRVSGGHEEIERELLKLEIRDLEVEIGRRLNEAISSLTSAIISLLDKAVYCTPDGPKTVDIKLDTSITEGLEKLPTINKVIDTLRSRRQMVLINVAEKLTEVVTSRGPIIFASSPSEAQPILFSFVKDTLRSWNSVTLYLTEPRVVQFREGTWVYIPPKVIKASIDVLFKQIEKEFSNKYNVKRVEDGNQVVFVLEPKQLPPVKEERSVIGQIQVRAATQVPSATSAKDVYEVIDEVVASGGGILWIAIEISKDSVNVIKESLSPIRKYIKSFKVEQSYGN